MSIRFHQPCPTCGRRLAVRANLVGRLVACQHCGCEFQSGEPTSDCISHQLKVRVEAALARVEALQSAEATS